MKDSAPVVLEKTNRPETALALLFGLHCGSRYGEWKLESSSLPSC